MLFDQVSQAMRSGRLAEAEAICRKMLANEPKNFDVVHMLAVICSEKGEYDESERLFRKAISLDPHFPPCYHNHGLALAKQEKYAAAVTQFDKALSLFSNFAPAHCDRGSALKELGRFDEALTSLNKAIDLAPNVPMVWFNRANLFFVKQDYNAALEDYDRAIKINSGYADAWVGRANVLADLKRHDEALAAYAKALSLKPDLSEAHFNESHLRLLLGDMKAGLKKYEYRWDTKQLRGWKRHFPQPLWLGESDLRNKAILIHAEQGAGDTLMCCRYVPLLAASGARVILEVQPAVRSLMRSLEGVWKLLAKGEPLPEADVHCPIMSLPLAFNTTLETIPARVPYLAASPDKIASWRQRLSWTEIKVGVAWAGNPNFPKDRDRSMRLKNMLPLFQVKGIKYVSLQKDLRPGDKEELEGNPEIARFHREIHDFEDTAAIMMSLDLVITVDTSVANLAGALGRPVWVLLGSNPDWRWLLDRGDSPWYPTARLFRQAKRGDWGAVVDEACGELKKMVVDRKDIEPRDTARK